MNKLIVCLVLSLSLTAVYLIANHSNNSTLRSGSCTCPDIESLVSTNEGKRSCVYKDTKGIPTIGIGFNLQRSDAKSLI